MVQEEAWAMKLQARMTINQINELYRYFQPCGKVFIINNFDNTYYYNIYKVS